METRANYVIVGVFTLLALLAAFGFVYWTARYGDRTETVDVIIRIPGSAAGLGRGSAILFNGIRVGEVTNVFLDAQNPSLAIAGGAIDVRTPLKPSTRAALGVQGLTGQAYVEFKGGNADEPNLIGATKGPIDITADPSSLNDVVDAARTIVNRADAVLTNLEQTVADVRAPLTNTVKNAETFSNALAANSDGVEAFLKNVSELSQALAGTGARLDATLTKVDGVLDAVVPDKVRATLSNIEKLTADLAASSGEVDALMASVKETSARAQAAINRVDTLVATVKPEDISRIVADIKTASGGAPELIADAQQAAKDVRELTARLAGEADGVSTIIKDTGEMMARLNAASVRVDGVLQKVDALLGSGEANGVMTELRATLAAYRQLANTINARAPEIANGLARFTGGGLRDIQQAVGAAQTSIQRIERAITDLSANPQRILSGGQGEVRTYGDRQRR